ncbi:MAG: glycosyltransferase family 4 protein [Anaerolineae bacterium]|nr:glycosyltransferase family 4 protein [Anaerolineae bacterium]
MRVLMLSKACIVGIYQRKLEAIAELGVDLLTLVPPSWKDERGETRLERAYTQGYRLEETPIWFNGSFHLHLYPHFARVLRQFRPDIVHIDEEPYNAATWQALYAARRVGAKTLFFSWQNIQRNYPPPFSLGERWVLRQIDYALMGTESAAQVWRSKGYTGPLRVVPQFGVDPELFHPQPQDPNRPFTIGYFGRLVPEKGLTLLLDAVTRLEGDWWLRLVGGGPQRAELQALAQQLGIVERVTFCDLLPSAQMPAQYAALDAYVLPSLTRPNWKEQFGRVLVEAMASGVPVIGSDSGAIPDVIGEAGLIFPEGDAAALASQLRRLQADSTLRQTLAVQGRARVLKHFTHQQVAQATVEVYRAMMDSRQ